MAEPGFVRRNVRWLAAGFLLTFASSLGQTFFIALFAPELRAETGLSHGEFGTVYTAATLAGALAMIWVGKSADLIAFHKLAAAVLVSLGFAAVVMSQVASATALLVAMFALRLFGQAMPGHVASTAMARWFAAGRGRALSLSSLGRAAGEAVLPSAAVAMVALAGWRTTWIVAAAVTVGLIMPICVVLLRRPPPEREAAADPGRPAGQAVSGRDRTRAEVARDPLFWALLLGIIAPPFLLTGVFFHQAHIVAVKGWTLAQYAASFTAYSLGAVLVALAAGWAIDRWSARRLLPFCLVPLGLGLVILAETGMAALAFVFMALFGASNGATGTLGSALWAELYGTRHLGAIRALVLAGVVASTAIAPGAMGVLIDAGVGVEAQIRAAAVYTFLAIALLSVLGRRVARLRTGAA